MRFPEECSRLGCEHLKCWESGIMEITCRCEAVGVEADADEYRVVECPVNKFTEVGKHEDQGRGH